MIVMGCKNGITSKVKQNIVSDGNTRMEISKK